MSRLLLIIYSLFNSLYMVITKPYMYCFYTYVN